jgi:hypothetical protein
MTQSRRIKANVDGARAPVRRVLALSRLGYTPFLSAFVGRIGLVCAAGITLALTGAALSTSGASATSIECRIGDMRLMIGPPVPEKTEQHTATVSLTNLAVTTCRLDGYPTISLFDAHGRLHFLYSHRGDQMTTGARPDPIALRPRVTAFFAFNKNVCITLATRVARTLRVILPGSRASQSLVLPRGLFIDYCRSSDPGGTVTLSPFELNLKDTACRSQRSCRRPRP